jgi:hypothetical protein
MNFGPKIKVDPQPATDEALNAAVETGEREKKSHENELKKELKGLLKECGFRSSAHGLPSLTVSKVNIFLKIIWILVVLTSWSYFLYLVYSIVTSYKSYAVISSLSVGYEAPTTFPGKL